MLLGIALLQDPRTVRVLNFESHLYPTTMIEGAIVRETYVVGSLGDWPGPMSPEGSSAADAAKMGVHGSVLYVVPTSGVVAPSDCRVIIDGARTGVPRS